MDASSRSSAAIAPLLLDNAAIAALKQWQYTPLILNGIPTPFVLTVTFTFSAR